LGTITTNNFSNENLGIPCSKFIVKKHHTCCTVKTTSQNSFKEKYKINEIFASAYQNGIQGRGVVR